MPVLMVVALPLSPAHAQQDTQLMMRWATADVIRYHIVGDGGLALPDSESVRISADKKSIVVKRDGWTWTYTPSIIDV